MKGISKYHVFRQLRLKAGRETRILLAYLFNFIRVERLIEVTQKPSFVSCLPEQGPMSISKCIPEKGKEIIITKT